MTFNLKLKSISVAIACLFQFAFSGQAQSISFEQVASATPQSPTDSVSVTYPAAQAAGNLNVVVVGWSDDVTTSVQSVTDSAGNVYHLAIGPTVGDGLQQSIYYASSIVGGTNTVTVTFDQAVGYPDVRVLEYQGLTAVDVTAAASGESATPSSGMATTTSANELIFGAETISNSTLAAGNGFTARIITSPDRDLAEDELVATTASYDATATLTSDDYWVMQMVAFSAATGPAPTVASVTPNRGPTTGGTAITITGTNFAAGASVIIGGVSATNVVVVNNTTITATTQSASAGSATVTVASNGQSGNLANGFTNVVVSQEQVAYATPQTPTNTVSVIYPAAQTAGNMNVVVVGWNDTTSSVSSVTDSTGNVYHLAIGPTAGDALQQAIYYSSNIAGGTNTVTVTFTQAAVYPDIRILEYQGLSAVDVTAGASGNSDSPSSGTATTTSANELIFGAETVYTLTLQPGTGFTTQIDTLPDGDLAEDELVTAVGSYSATATLKSAGPWVMQMVAFSPVGGIATPTFSPAAGTYTSTQTVTINDSVSGATIYYTTNGTSPTTSSSVYSGPITVSSSETLEAIATDSGYPQSAVGFAAYTISSGETQATGAVGYTYDSLGRLHQAQYTTSSGTITVTYSYDGAGNRTSVVTQ